MSAYTSPINTRGILKILLILFTCVVLIFGFACTSTFGSSSMQMMSGESIVSQNIMPQCCGAAFAHFQAWRETFIAAPRGGWNIILALASGIFALFALAHRTARMNVAQPIVMSHARYARHNAQMRPFNYIHTFLVRGILNPKIF